MKISILRAFICIAHGMGIDSAFMAFTNFSLEGWRNPFLAMLASLVLGRSIAAALLLPLGTYLMYD